MAPFSESDFTKINKEHAQIDTEEEKAQMEMHNTSVALQASIAQVSHMEKLHHFLASKEAKMICCGLENMEELKKLEVQEDEEKQQNTESTTDSLPALDPSFFETLLPGVMSQFDFLGGTFKEVPSNS